MLHQLASQLRQRRGANGEGGDTEGEDGMVILDDNCEVSRTEWYNFSVE